MKSFIKLVLTAVLLSAGLKAQVPVWDGSVAETFGGGTGTAEDPYLIETPAQLAKLAQDVNARNAYDSAYFRLESDMDLGGGQGLRWEPIGTRYTNAFNGHFDGNYKHITGLYVNDTNKKTDGAGLFGVIGSPKASMAVGSVRCLMVSGKVEVGLVSSAGMVAAMSGGKTLIEDCISFLEIEAPEDRSPMMGGIIGSCRGVVRRCIFGGHMRNGFHVGGIAGMVSGCIEEVMNFGYIENLRGTAGYTGGITGSCSGKVQNAFNSGSVWSYSMAGGIVASFNPGTGGVLADCLNVGYVSGRGVVGMIMGYGEATGKVYYDVQVASGLMAGDEYHDGSYSQRVLTRALISGNSEACAFSAPEKWTFKAGSYPVVKALAEHDNALMAQLAALAAVPVVSVDHEAWCALKSDFTVGTKITTAAGEKDVNWGTDMPGLVSFSGNKGTLQRPGTDTVVSFYAEIAGLPCRKQIRFQHYKIYEDMKAPAFKTENGKKTYEISEFAHLAWVNAIANGVIYMAAEEYAAAMPQYLTFTGTVLDITADIDMDGYNWIPIAGCGFASRYFGGLIRGNGHALRNLTIDRPGENYIGFISFLGGNGSGVQNLRLSGGQVRSSAQYTGALVGISYMGDILRCTNESCTVNGAWQSAGLVGIGQGTHVSRCANWADVTASGSYAGGIVAIFYSDNNRYARMEQSYNRGAIYATEGSVGGLTALVGTYSTVTDCFNSGNIGGDKDMMGGIAGSTQVDAALQNCYNVGKITKPAGMIGKQRIGDILGENGGKVFSNNYYNKEINGIGAVAEADCKGVEAWTTAEMKHTEAFVKALGKNVWYLDEKDENEGYPIFSWMASTADNEEAVSRVASALALRVYPNPVSETVYVEEDGLCELAVYRLTGERVLRRSGRDLRRLDVSDLPDGLYVLRAKGEQGRVYTSKLSIVKH